jgi:hypothetical protein
MMVGEEGGQIEKDGWRRRWTYRNRMDGEEGGQIEIRWMAKKVDI